MHDDPIEHALTLIGIERGRQVQDLGWDSEHDDNHLAGELAMAAACYAAGSCGTGVFVAEMRSPHSINIEDAWPWDQEDDKRARDLDGEIAMPGNRADERGRIGARIRLLVKAGAWICAEIDRLERVKHASQ